MAYFTTTRPASFGMGSFARTLIDTIVSWHERRITRNELYRLSDRELDDIGLTRGDIDSVVDRLR